MVNYNKSHIYKLCCKDTDIKEIYIGSTTNFRNRKSQHKSVCNNINEKGYNCKVYSFIREHGGFQNWDMILIETVSCNTKLELLKIERKYIEELKPSLNKEIPSRTQKEWQKEYLENNKERIKEYSKEYRENNKDKTNKYNREWGKMKITCECGSIITKNTKHKHKRSKKHIKFLNTQSVAH